MSNYFNLLGRHGLKMWGSNLLGVLAVTFITFLIVLLLMIVGTVGFVSSLSNAIDPGAGLESVVPAIVNSGTIGLIVVLFLVYFVLLVFIQAFTSAGAYGVASEVIQQNSVTIGSYFRHGFRKLFPMLGQTVVISLLTVPLLALFGLSVLMMTSGGAVGVAFGALMLLVTIVATLVFLVIIMHAPAALVAEDKKVFESLAESFRVFKQQLKHVLLSVLILVGIGLVGGGIITLLNSSISGVSFTDGYLVEPNPFRVTIANLFTFPMYIALNVVTIFTLVFRYLHVIKGKLVDTVVKPAEATSTSGGSPNSAVDSGQQMQPDKSVQASSPIESPPGAPVQAGKPVDSQPNTSVQANEPAKSQPSESGQGVDSNEAGYSEPPLKRESDNPDLENTVQAGGQVDTDPGEEVKENSNAPEESGKLDN